MTQICSAQAQTLEESSHLIAILESQTAIPPFARNALARQRALHQHLEEYQHRSEQALAAWRAALTHRWQCEIEGQRHYMLLLKQLRDHYGADSPQLTTVMPTHTTYTGSAEDLLHDMQRLHAALRLLPGTPITPQRMDELATACAELEHALNETYRCETERRNASLDRRLAQDACAHAIAETTEMLARHFHQTHPTIETLLYAEAQAGLTTRME
jgi:hypothetical protein